MKNFLIVLGIVLFFLIPTLFVFSQPPSGGGAQTMDIPPDPPGGDPDVPITGLEYLLISGGILGGYKLLKKKIAKSETGEH